MVTEDRIRELQHYFQNKPKHTYLKVHYYPLHPLHFIWHCPLSKLYADCCLCDFAGVKLKGGCFVDTLNLKRESIIFF